MAIKINQMKANGPSEVVVRRLRLLGLSDRDIIAKALYLLDLAMQHRLAIGHEDRAHDTFVVEAVLSLPDGI